MTLRRLAASALLALLATVAQPASSWAEDLYINALARPFVSNEARVLVRVLEDGAPVDQAPPLTFQTPTRILASGVDGLPMNRNGENSAFVFVLDRTLASGSGARHEREWLAEVLAEHLRALSGSDQVGVFFVDAPGEAPEPILAAGTSPAEAAAAVAEHMTRGGRQSPIVQVTRDAVAYLASQQNALPVHREVILVSDGRPEDVEEGRTPPELAESLLELAAENGIAVSILLVRTERSEDPSLASIRDDQVDRLRQVAERTNGILVEAAFEPAAMRAGLATLLDAVRSLHTYSIPCVDGGPLTDHIRLSATRGSARAERQFRSPWVRRLMCGSLEDVCSDDPNCAVAPPSQAPATPLAPEAEHEAVGSSGPPPAALTARPSAAAVSPTTGDVSHGPPWGPIAGGLLMLIGLTMIGLSTRGIGR